MSNITIVTNNHPREVLYGHDVPEAVRGDFEYLEDINSSFFFKYKGDYYDLGEFMLIGEDTDDFEGWNGVSSTSAFSGTLIKLSDCGDVVIVGRFWS